MTLQECRIAELQKGLQKGSAIPSFCIYRRRHRHPRPQQVLGVLSAVEDYLDWHALNHLYIVAGGIFRRQHAEACPSGRSDAVDVSGKLTAAVRIDGHGGALSRLHVGELRLLEIRGHPDVVERYQRHQRLTRLYDLTGLDAFPT